MSWGRRDHPDLAVRALLDAAEACCVDRGVAATSMADVARAAGCSRATLYRYFPTRDELRLAYVDREALRIARAVSASVTPIADPAQRLVAAVLAAVEQVRGTPPLAAWFTVEEQGLVNRMAADSDLVPRLAAGLLGDDVRAVDARWLVRAIVSLLTWPAGADEERELVERFVVPPVMAHRRDRVHPSGAP